MAFAARGLWMASLFLVAGCGKSDGVALVPVSGKVTIAGEAPTRGGSITFTVVEPAEGYPSRPGSARFAEDGTFEAMSFKEGDGLVPGTYNAVIEYYEGAPSDDDPTSFDRLNMVPKDFRPEVVVDAAAGSVEANFDVPPKKKQ
jgi:hypothetical protein